MNELTEQSPIKQWALHYASLGWRVFPLTPGTKVPLAGSCGHKDASSDRSAIEAWWTEHPEANIGLATGAASAVWVIDIDMKNDKNGRRALQQFLTATTDDPQIDTKTVQTPSGGAHIYVAYDRARPVSNRANVLEGIDIRGDGGYVVLPPSRTDVGAYRWAPAAMTTGVGAADWAFALASHYGPIDKPIARPSSKVDGTYRLPWALVVGFRSNPHITLEQTEVGRKYICRCPFHDDKSASAAFWRKDAGFGVLYCSACDTSWITEKRVIGRVKAAKINARLEQLKQQIKELT